MTTIAYIVSALALAVTFVLCVSEATDARSDAKFIALFVAGWTSLVGCVAFVVMLAGAPAPF